ncbi:pyridoxal phosphate-dependent transferase [Aspergillus recurvatus]
MSKPLFPLDAFQSTPGTTHVCAAGESLPLLAHNDAFARFLNHKAAGHVGSEEKDRQVNEVRGLIAQQWQVSSQEIGFTSSVADGISMIVESLHWQEGDHVIVDPDEFPSLIAPFVVKGQLHRERHGVEVPKVRYAGAEDLESAVDNKTRLVVVSYVSYLNSKRVDLAFYRKLADSAGAMLVVDYSQAAGYAPIDASIADFAFSCCHKWLLGTTGVAIAYCNRTRQPGWKPSTAGWYSLSATSGQPRRGLGTVKLKDDARVFTRGNPSHLSIYMLREALDFLRQWEPIEIERHVQTLTAELLKLLDQEGIPSSTPWDKERHGGSVTVHCAGAAKIVDELRKAGIYAWNGNGRIRISFHGYNSLRDVERIMEVFPALWKEFHV